MIKHYKELVKIDAKIFGKMISAYYFQQFIGSNMMVLGTEEDLEKYKISVRKFFEEAEQLRAKKSQLKRRYKHNLK